MSVGMHLTGEDHQTHLDGGHCKSLGTIQIFSFAIPVSRVTGGCRPNVIQEHNGCMQCYRRLFRNQALGLSTVYSAAVKPLLVAVRFYF